MFEMECQISLLICHIPHKLVQVKKKHTISKKKNFIKTDICFHTIRSF